MVVAEILTGIALVQKSVEFIKSNISTANDIKDIANQIDGFFTGEAQMNKKQGKGMSIAEQFGSVENSATDFIDRKLLEEKRNELKQIINLRFGPTAWDEIISERATRIAEAKEVITVAPQKDICPQGSTYPINAVRIIRSKITTPTIQTSSRGLA